MRIIWKPIAGLAEHPAARLVPEMRLCEYARLLAEVRQHGLREPLRITGQGLVLDGRHRLRVARELDLELVPVLVEDAVADEVELIVQAAVCRRQLSDSQLAAVAVEYTAYQTDRERGIQRQRANLRHACVEVEALPPRRGRARDRAAALVGVSGRLIQDAQKIHDRDSRLFEQVKAGELTVNKAIGQVKQAERYAQIGQPPPLPSGLFDLIYADPPWQLGNPQSTSAPERHYPTLPLEQIAALAVPAAENALLYLWAVNSRLRQALQVMEAWDFDYRSNEVWVKPWIGMGVWTRNRHELLLIGRKGNASPAPRQLLLDSVIEAKRGRHSEKPTLVYQRLEHLYPHHRRLELFARGTPRPGWTSWGNQIDPAIEEAA